LFLFRMSRFRLPLRRQVRVPSVGRVDFLIGTKLGVWLPNEENTGAWRSIAGVCGPDR